MTNTTGNIYSATIPGASVGDTICYIVSATDNTACSNQASFPTAGCTEFEIKSNPPPVCVGTPVFNFTYNENFGSFTPGNGNANNPGTLANNWVNDATDTHDWYVLNQAN